MALDAHIIQPFANVLVVIGELITISGTVDGLAGAEPVSPDSVMVQIGTSPPVEAMLVRAVGHPPQKPPPSWSFHASVRVPGPAGSMTVVVRVHFDSNVDMVRTRTVNASAGELTGVWSADDGGVYFLKQDISNLWWVGLDGHAGVQRPGLTVTTVFLGQLQSIPALQPAAAKTGPVTGPGIGGSWADVPRGTRMRSGTLTLRPIRAADGSIQQLQVTASSGGFTTTMLTRTIHQAAMLSDLQTLLASVQKNVGDGETLGGGNLKAYKDHVVVFGHLLGIAGQNVVVNWAVNAGRTYKDFICAHADGNHDADANTDIAIDRQRLDSGGDFSQPNFWTEGWEPGVDPEVIQHKLNGTSNALHLEMVMFGRGARCDQPDRFDDPPLVPGWNERDGNSVLINGRPVTALRLDPIDGFDSVPSRVVLINGKVMSAGTLVRVSGPLVLDCGHLEWSDPFDSCREDDFDVANQEIHPVYAIDVVDATPRVNLSGVWGDNLGMTYYVRHIADSIWWFGMGPVRETAFGQVFRGTLKDRTIDGVWRDVPFGTGDSGGALRLTVDPGLLQFAADPQGAFSNRRWLKLYDARP